MAAQMPPEMRDKVMHVSLEAKGATLMGSDAPPDRFKPAQGFAVSVNVDTADEAERIFAALSEGATVGMPIQETFWATRFGMLVDRFGTPWMVNCEKRGV
jgi:PhnB protein